jgi:hypothetical protein
MVAVAVIAILLSLPPAVVMLFGFYGTILVAIILAAAAVARSGRRIEAAYWASALHPLLILVWLSAWRLFAFPQNLGPADHTPLFDVILSMPYVMAVLSLFYLPVVAFLVRATAALHSCRQSVSEALLIVPIVWLTTLLVLLTDPFKLFVWMRD